MKHEQFEYINIQFQLNMCEQRRKGSLYFIPMHISHGIIYSKSAFAPALPPACGQSSEGREMAPLGTQSFVTSHKGAEVRTSLGLRLENQLQRHCIPDQQWQQKYRGNVFKF